jgi:hypothetical protein
MNRIQELSGQEYVDEYAAKAKRPSSSKGEEESE